MLKRVMRSDVCSCVLRMFLHATVACGTEILVYLTSSIEWLCLYESLLTYIAHMDLVGDPASRYLPRTRVRVTHY